MKFAILADIHSNLEAFEEVLGRIKNVDKIICLGDVVGYGPNPNECIELIKQHQIICIAGNHDKAVTGELTTQAFNREAKDAILWTKITLTKENLAFLKALPVILDLAEFQIVHGSLDNPLENYITNMDEAKQTLKAMSKTVCFVGHSHQPLLIGQKADGIIEGKIINDKDCIKVSDYAKSIINVGSVGQPRDHDPRAGYLIYNHGEKTAEFHRLHYNLKLVQQKMLEAELPDPLINRLALGL
jgi:predicted phosphodiesterase